MHFFLKVKPLYVNGLHTSFLETIRTGFLMLQYIEQKMSHHMTKPTMWFLNRSDTNRAVQAQKMARGWKFILDLRSYCEADLCLCFCICRLLVFSCRGSNNVNLLASKQ